MPTRSEDVGVGSKTNKPDSVVKWLNFLGSETVAFVEGDGITKFPVFLENPRSRSCKVVVGASPRRNQKNGRLNFERVKKGRSLCVMGRYVTCDMVEALSERDLVGRFEYIKLSREEILS